MPRDSSGNYTLPAGNPVVTGTTVDSTWANNTMSDLKTAMQDSLSRSGDGGMLVAFKNADGSVSAPGVTFTNETGSGLYRAGTNDVRVSVAGVDRARFRADSSNPFQIYNGSSWTNILYAGANATITGNWSFTGSTFGVTAAVTIVGNVGITGALTATSFGGITSANLLDKSATETVSGDWTFSGSMTIPQATVTAHQAALTIAETQISDGAVLARVASTETITGTWTLDGAVTTSGYGTGGRVKDGIDTSRPMGFNVMPVFEQDSSDTFDLAHNGMLWHKDSGSAVTYTCANDSTIPQGATYVIANEDTEDLTIADGSITLRWFNGDGTPQTGDRTLAEGGVCTVYKYSDTEFWIWGNGLS